MEKIHTLHECYLSNRVCDMVVGYSIFAMEEHRIKNGKQADCITKPVIIDFGDRSVVSFQIDSTKHEMGLPRNEWRLKKKVYYTLQILQYPRQSSKSLIKYLVDSGYFGALCYIKKGRGAVLNLEMYERIENVNQISEAIGNGISFNFQSLKRKPKLSDEFAKWVSFNDFLTNF